ncbi:MAG: aminotransferase class III-fold pyridoxal phosphate-dependent enzyme [bacterium]
MGISQDLYNKAKTIIPGGTQLLSKRPEMHLPDLWPAYYEKAKGCEIWDLDGEKYIDMSFMGVGASILGYSDDDVNAAVTQAIAKGSSTTLNCYEDVELAELLCELHPWAEMVRYSRTGGEAMSIAVRIARAAADKDVILFSGYHGWHDWYLSSNLADDAALDGHLMPGLSPKGVPRGLKGTAKPFIYNDTEEYLALLNKYKGRIAGVVTEAVRNHEPKPGFIETIRKTTKELGIVMICDEVSSGWRLNVGGAHLKYGFEPDIAVFAKGISNGFPMAAIIGKKSVMQVAQESFISSTYWTERIGPVAALATIAKMQKENVPAHLIKIGKMVQAGWDNLAKKHRIIISVEGIPPLGHFSFKYDNALAIKTLFTQIMLEKGCLATNSFYASFAHSPEIVDKYLFAVDEAFAVIASAIQSAKVESSLKGPVCHAGFKRLD